MTWRSSRKRTVVRFLYQCLVEHAIGRIVHVWYILLQEQWVKQLSSIINHFFFTKKTNLVNILHLYNSFFLAENFWFVPKLLWTLKDCSYSNTEHKKNSRSVLLFIFFFTYVNEKNRRENDSIFIIQSSQNRCFY